MISPKFLNQVPREWDDFIWPINVGAQVYENKKTVGDVVELSPEAHEIQLKFNSWCEKYPSFSSVADRISISNEGVMFDSDKKPVPFNIIRDNSRRIHIQMMGAIIIILWWKYKEWDTMKCGRGELSELLEILFDLPIDTMISFADTDENMEWNLRLERDRVDIIPYPRWL